VRGALAYNHRTDVLQFLKSQLRRALGPIRRDLETVKILAAQPLVRQIRAGQVFSTLSDSEFRVFSQFGDDGIIQFLTHTLRPLPEAFIEFGVEDYRESNTRFLLVNDNWRGLVMDAGERCIDYITRDEIYWRHTLTARQAFVTRDNINDLISGAGFGGQIGLLSIDIDGNDYWVWERLTVVDAAIVVVEYNSVFGPDLAVTIPYDAGFTRYKAHSSGLFWGASLTALASLAATKNYSLVGCNSAGNNAYFVRNDKVGGLQIRTVREAFVDARFRDSRDDRGQLTYLTGPERLRAIAGMQVHDLRQNRVVPLQSLIGA